jgi:3-dehydroquinate dehydratase-1
VVGTVHSAAGLALAQRLKPDDVDVLELRLDALADRLPDVRRALPKLKVPLLITARHPAEGGVGNLTLRQRVALLEEFLPAATLVDVELRSVAALEKVWRAFQPAVTVVVSDHHFRRMPALAAMRERQKRAFAAGADVFKIAAVTPRLSELRRLMELLDGAAAGPRAVMGMGAFGPVSRLVLAQGGSVLNYGYLDQPNAPGQWEARELKRLIGALTPVAPRPA